MQGVCGAILRVPDLREIELWRREFLSALLSPKFDWLVWFSCLVVPFVFKQLPNSSYLLLKVVGLHLESDWSSTSKVQNGQVLNLNQSASSQHLPEVQTESISFPSTPCVSKLQTECGKSSSQCHNSDKSKSGSVSVSHLSKLCYSELLL